MFALDTETTGLDLWHGCRPFFVSVAFDDGNLSVWEWDVDPLSRVPIIPKEDLAEIRSLLNSNTERVLHNTGFDYLALQSIGLGPEQRKWNMTQDTVLMHHCLASAESHKLKDLAIQYLEIDDTDQQELQEATNEARRIARGLGWRVAAPFDPHFPSMKRAPYKAGWWVMDTWLPRAVAKHKGYRSNHPWYTVLRKYGSQDAERTILLYGILREALEEEGLVDVYNTRRKLLPIVYDMSQMGITASKKRLDELSARMQLEADKSEDVCYKLAGGVIDNVNSPKQLQGVLFGTFKLKPIKSTKEGFSTDADTLTALQEEQLKPADKPYQFIKHLKRSRQYSKACDSGESYWLSRIEIWKQLGVQVKGGDDGSEYFRLCPSFNISGTKETRLSSNNPNAQNINKKEGTNLRYIFGPLPGREWYSIDYSNIELRIFAYSSGDRELIKAFESGYSVHLIIAEILHPELFAECLRNGWKFKDKYESTWYQWVKNGNFSLIYGAAERRADATYRVKGAYRKIRKRLPKIDEFMGAKYAEGIELGYVTALGGYRLQVPPDEPHVACNYYVQGSAGWAVIIAMIRVSAYLEWLNKKYGLTGRDRYSLIMNIHDELDFDFPVHPRNHNVIKYIAKLMEQSGEDLGLPTPVEVERHAHTWDKGEKVSFTQAV